MPLRAPFETSFGRVRQRRILLVEADVDGTIGWGEAVAGETPFYAPETVETAWHILRDFLWPMLGGIEFESAADIWGMLGRVRGHNMAKGGLEAAIWDAEARLRQQPLWKLLGGTRSEIPSGVSIGIQSSLDALVSIVEHELQAGYQRIKIKIKPGWDIQPVERLRRQFPNLRLMVDANSAYGSEDVTPLRQLDAYYLMMIEQPLDWDDLGGHAELQQQLKTPICLDESISSERQALAAINIGACQVINVKLGRVGGFSVARRVHDLCQSRQIPVWCGGMLESGIGRAHNIALSTLPNFSLPGDVSASRRYWEEDIIEPEVELTSQGTIRVPTGSGVGFTPRRNRIEQLTVRKEVLS